MKYSNMTTADLLRLENAGGVLTNGDLPSGLDGTASVHDWVNHFPEVDPSLVVAMFRFREAKITLSLVIDGLTRTHVKNI